MSFPEPTWWNGTPAFDGPICVCGETEHVTRYRGEWWCEKCIEDEEEFCKQEEASR